MNHQLTMIPLKTNAFPLKINGWFRLYSLLKQNSTFVREGRIRFFFPFFFLAEKKMGRIFLDALRNVGWRRTTLALFAKGLDVNTINTMKSLDSVIGARKRQTSQLPILATQKECQIQSLWIKSPILSPALFCRILCVCLCHICGILGGWKPSMDFFFGWQTSWLAAVCDSLDDVLPQASRYRMHVTQFLLDKDAKQVLCTRVSMEMIVTIVHKFLYKQLFNGTYEQPIYLHRGYNPFAKYTIMDIPVSCFWALLFEQLALIRPCEHDEFFAFKEENLMLKIPPSLCRPACLGPWMCVVLKIASKKTGSGYWSCKMLQKIYPPWN